MKSFLKSFYLISGFIVGVVYITACGGGQSVVADIANTITNALGLNYDNAKSGLKATNVQDAIDELNALLVNVAKTNIGEELIGSWKGTELKEPGLATASGFIVTQNNFTIIFNQDGSYTCENSTLLGSLCSNGNWIQQGMYLWLLSGSNVEVLDVGNISKNHLLINTNGYGFWALHRQ